MNTEVINHSFSARVKKGITTYFKENLAILVAFIILCVGLSIATPAFFYQGQHFECVAASGDQ